MSDEVAIHATAVHLLKAMETPINGIPSVRVLNRDNAERFIAAAMRAVWEAKTQQEPPHAAR
mgnify:CR=1 FL=1